MCSVPRRFNHKEVGVLTPKLKPVLPPAHTHHPPPNLGREKIGWRRKERERENKNIKSLFVSRLPVVPSFENLIIVIKLSYFVTFSAPEETLCYISGNVITPKRDYFTTSDVNISQPLFFLTQMKRAVPLYYSPALIKKKSNYFYNHGRDQYRTSEENCTSLLNG